MKGYSAGSLTDSLSSEQVLARFQARRDGEIRISVIDEEQIRTPLVGGSVEAILSDLEPLEAYVNEVFSEKASGNDQEDAHL